MTDRERNDREFCDRRGDLNVESVGPFERFPVAVNGWTVPYLEAQNKRDGGVYVTLDERLGLDLPDELAGMVLSFLADAIAIGMGYACHPRDNEPPRRRPWTRLAPLGEIEEGGAL